MVWNEGNLPEGLTIEDLKRKHSSRPRNPILAGVFFKGGLIEAWGRGTINIVNECIAAGLPEPTFKSEFGGISITLFKDKYTEKYLEEIGLNERQIVRSPGCAANKDGSYAPCDALRYVFQALLPSSP